MNEANLDDAILERAVFTRWGTPVASMPHPWQHAPRFSWVRLSHLTTALWSGSCAVSDRLRCSRTQQERTAENVVSQRARGPVGLQRWRAGRLLQERPDRQQDQRRGLQQRAAGQTHAAGAQPCPSAHVASTLVAFRFPRLQGRFNQRHVGDFSAQRLCKPSRKTVKRGCTALGGCLPAILGKSRAPVWI